MEPDAIWSTPSTPIVPVRRHRRLSSVINPVILTIAFSVLLVLIIFLLIPPTLSRHNQVLKPNSSVKKSWNSINIFLVLFAVLCGVFARRNDETSSSYGAETVPINAYEIVNSGMQSVSGVDWLESSDRKAYDKMSDHMNTGGNRLRRSSSSYPDLRQESLWGSDGEKFKFFDDFEVDFHRHVRQSHEMEKDVVPVGEISVDKFELKNSVRPPPTLPVSQVPQPPPPPPPPVKMKRSVYSVVKQYNVERGGHEAEFNEKRSSVPPPSRPPPPPPPPGPKFHPPAERREKFQRKKNGTTKEFATAIVSLYQGTQGKMKKKGKSRYIFESVAQNSSSPTVLPTSSTPSVPPPPPPPPPSKKVLHNFFKKSSKSKRVHSVSTANPPTPPPPPPPPPPSSIFNNIFKTGSKSKRFQLTSASSQSLPPPPPPPPSTILNSLFKNGTRSRGLKYTETQPPPPLPTTPRSRPKHIPASTGKPPKKPTKPSTDHHESVVISPASPSIPMPPPPPPFTMPELKLITKGDFVRISSANSSRCSSPGPEDLDVMSVKSDGGDSIGPSFTCPSPDVDSKADTFISKLRDEWRLEKINSP